MNATKLTATLTFALALALCQLVKQAPASTGTASKHCNTSTCREAAMSTAPAATVKNVLWRPGTRTRWHYWFYRRPQHVSHNPGTSSQPIWALPKWARY